MRQVFRARPWVLPHEPKPLVEIFKQYGTVQHYEKDFCLPHGGGEDAKIALLLDGLVSFSFIDAKSQHRIFALVLPGRTIGDLDALNQQRTNVLAECIRPSTVLQISRAEWRQALRSSIDLMELYADISILKEESILEGAFANYTLDLDERLRVMLYAIMQGTHTPIDLNAWNLCPIGLTVTELAKIVAANRSWVSTKLSAWAAEGLFEHSGREFRFHGKLFDPIHDWMHRQDEQIRPSLESQF